MPDEEKQENAICPCCGQPTLKKPVRIDGKIVDEYLAGIITGEPFSHTFEMFDGRLNITCSMTSRDDGLVFWRFLHFVEPYKSEATFIQDLLGLVSAYCGIKKIAVKGKDDTAKTYEPAEKILAECKLFLNEWETVPLADADKKHSFVEALGLLYDNLKQTDVTSSTPPVILSRVNSDFRALETVMLEAGFDENFWKGIELG